MKGIQGGQSPSLLDDVPVEYVGFIPISSTVARVPSLFMQELNGNRQKLNHMGRNHPGKRPSPICPSKPIYSLSSRCTHVKRPTKVHLPALQPTNARFTPGRGTAFLTNSGDCYKRHDAQIDTMVFATNAVAFTPPEDIPPHSDRLDGEPSVKNPAMPSIPAVESSNQREQSHRADVCRGE